MTLLQMHGLVRGEAAHNPTAPEHRLLLCDSLGALVTELSKEFDFENPDDLADWATRHHGILLAYCAQGPVLPLAIGSVFSSEEALKAKLIERHAEHLRVLDMLSGIEEYTVQLFPKDRIAAPSKAPLTGRRFLKARQVKRDQRRDLKTNQTAFACDLLAELQNMSLRPSTPDAKPGRLLNKTILIRKDTVSKLQELAAVSDQLARDLSLELKITGPWPPYSFDPSETYMQESCRAG
ncbi:GvpL/GvpF family gas vesicle protein [Cognatiyoonia sp. IB215182]|nr:GvpL/GvpF family gas vesicle protein [Cognatiyoonia sp. IB215182]